MRLALLAVTVLMFAPSALADESSDENGYGGRHETSEIAVTRGEIGDDLFTSGQTVDVDAEVAGDLFAAGGSVDIAGEVLDQVVAAGGRIALDAVIGGDALLAAGMITTRGTISDNLVVAGCSIDLESQVAGKAIASGCNVRLGRSANVGEDAWLAGGRVTLAGTVSGNARIIAGRALLLGDVAGNVEATAEEFEVGPGARIGGSLTLRGPTPPKIDETASVAGEVRHIEQRGFRHVAERAGPFLFVASFLPPLYLFVLAVLVALIFPGFVGRTAEALTDQPLASLGLGVLGVAATPPIMLLLLIVVIGVPFAAALGGLYVFALVFGIPMAVLAAVHAFARRHHAGKAPGRGALVGLSALVFAALWIVGLIPLIGGLVWLGATCIGIGAALLALYRAAEHQSPAAIPA